MRAHLARFALAAALLFPCATHAQNVSVGRAGAPSTTLDAAHLASLPATEVILTYGTPPQAVIPGDKRGGRGVHDAVRLKLEEVPKTTP